MGQLQLQNLVIVWVPGMHEAPWVESSVAPLGLRSVNNTDKLPTPATRTPTIQRYNRDRITIVGIHV